MEIQYLLSKNKPFLCIAKKGKLISKMILGSIHSNLEYYSDIEDLKIILKNILLK